jgi:predicted transcriptional regulator
MAYTSASTIIRILEQKGFVESRKEGKAHFYRPLLEKETYEERTLDHVITNVFDGTPTSLVKRLIGAKNLSKKDKEAIQKMLEEEW